MATNKNITMKQYNGTDYDTLYPKTKVSQVDGAVASVNNVTPDNTGAVKVDTFEQSIKIGKNVDVGTNGGASAVQFHFDGNTNAYTSRIVESESGALTVSGDLAVAGSMTLGAISNPTDVLKTLLNPTNFGYITDFNSGYGLTPGLWRFYNEDGSAANAPYSGFVSGVCLVIVVYESDGTMDKAHQLFLDGLGDVYYKVYNNGVSYGTWKKLTNEQ